MSNLEYSPCAHVHVHVVSVAGLILGYLEALVCFFLHEFGVGLAAE